MIFFTIVASLEKDKIHLIQNGHPDDQEILLMDRIFLNANPPDYQEIPDVNRSCKNKTLGFFSNINTNFYNNE